MTLSGEELFGGVLLIFLELALALPLSISAINTANNLTASGASDSATIYKLVPLFFAFVILATVIGLIVFAYKHR